MSAQERLEQVGFFPAPSASLPAPSRFRDWHVRCYHLRAKHFDEEASAGWRGGRWDLMAARSFWNGTIRIGSISLDVKLYSAAEDRSVRFHLLHAQDGQRVRQRL